MATCAQLVSEQEVQALSIDAATSNVEVHYAYICDAFGAFMQRYRAEHASHAGGLVGAVLGAVAGAAMGAVVNSGGCCVGVVVNCGRCCVCHVWWQNCAVCDKAG